MIQRENEFEIYVRKYLLFCCTGELGTWRQKKTTGTSTTGEWSFLLGEGREGGRRSGERALVTILKFIIFITHLVHKCDQE